MLISVTNETDERRRLASELRIAAFRLTRRLRLESHVDEVSDSQLTVLLHLSRVGPSTPGQLAEFERVSAPSMNRTVNALEAARCVRRVDDPNDGRRVFIELTERGAELARTARKRRTAWLDAELRPLSADDLAALARAVELIDGMVQR